MEDRDRFRGLYLLEWDEAEARAKAHDLCLEQTVECRQRSSPRVHPGPVVGRLEAFDVRIGARTGR